jgi:hypothetical protein
MQKQFGDDAPLTVAQTEKVEFVPPTEAQRAELEKPRSKAGKKGKGGKS